MTLPESFRWAHRMPLSKVPDALYLDREVVAMVSARVDSAGWTVRLECQVQDIKAPSVMHRCRSYETAQRLAEAWARRNRLRLRQEVDELHASRPRHNGAMGLGKD
jgi:hypothetical protein